MDSNTPVTREQIKSDYLIVHEFVEYLRWLASEDHTYQLTAGQVWQLFNLGVREGMVWSEAAENVGLPEHPDFA